MAFIQYLTFDGEALPEPDSYEVSMEDVEADSSGETEAGTTQRDVVRFGVHTISVSFTVTAKWLKKLTTYKQQAKLLWSFLIWRLRRLHLRRCIFLVTNQSGKRIRHMVGCGGFHLH